MRCEMNCIIGGFLLAYLSFITFKFFSLVFNKLLEAKQ